MKKLLPKALVGLTLAVLNSPIVKNKIRRRAYDTIDPTGDYTIDNAKHFITGEKSGNTNKEADTEWAMYLGIPQNERHYKQPDFKISQDKPSLSSEDKVYYEVPLTNDQKEQMIYDSYGMRVFPNENGIKLPFVQHGDILRDDNGNIIMDPTPIKRGENKVTTAPGIGQDLGYYTLGRGIDPKKGEYVSRWDKWDLNPFSGAYASKSTNWLKNAGDLSMGLGHPFEIYNRIYLNDYYGYPASEELQDITNMNKGLTRDSEDYVYFDRWLPEPVITAKQKTKK